MKTIELIKKDIVKHTPIADLLAITNKSIVYECTLSNDQKIQFKVPLTDIKQVYYKTMSSPVLIPYLITPAYIEDQKYVGMNILEAEQICLASKIKYRLVKKDDQAFIGTCDFLPERLNFETKKDLITKVTRG